MTLGTYVPSIPGNPERLITQWYAALAAIKDAGTSLDSGDTSEAASRLQALARILDEPTVSATTTTTTDDAGVALNLTTELGAAYFADSSAVYRINSRVVARGNGAEYYYWESNAVLLGGATPVLLEEALVADMDSDGFDPTVPAVSVSTADVVLSITGVSTNPANWRIECRVTKMAIAAASA